MTRTNQNATQLKITVLRCDEKNWIRSNKTLRIHHHMTCTKLIGHAACTKVRWNLHLETPNENLSKRFVSQSTSFREFVICDVKKTESSMINLRPCGMMFDWPVSTVPSGHHGRYHLAESWEGHYVSHLTETKLCETSWNFRGKNQRLNDIRVFWFEEQVRLKFSTLSKLGSHCGYFDRPSTSSS